MARETGEAGYLACLKIDDQYALERVRRVDEARTCTVIVDMDAPQTVSITTYLADVETGKRPPLTDSESAVPCAPPAEK